ncbi:MAG: CHAD domain-containing protein [Anaerolineae bacterium]
MSQRAKAILHWADDPDLDRAAEASGLRPAQVRYWIRAFHQSRLSIFPPDTLPPDSNSLDETGASLEAYVDSANQTTGAAGADLPAESPIIEEPAAKPKKMRRSRRFGFRPTDPMPEAGRRIMAFHFARLRKLESAAAEGDEEAIHDMRVAIRRLRAAFRIAGPFYKRKVVRSFRADLRDLADHLGAARDLDVILNHGLAFAQRQPPGAPKLDAWLDLLKSRRAEAQRDLVQFLGGKRFAKFAEAIEAFVTEPGAAVNSGDHPEGSPRVCDVIPVAVWTQYSVVRAYETLEHPSLESLHALRIEFKRLRYLLEFFREVLGAGAIKLIELTVRAQDHLGLLHDADVTAKMLGAYLAEHAIAGMGASDLAAVVAYLSEAQAEIQTRQDQFPEMFREITGKSFRKQLATLLGKV